MRIALAQIDPWVGDFEGNFLKIKEAYERACSAQARLLLTPELGVCGYPLLDLLLSPEVISRSESVVQRLAELTQGRKCALAVGHVSENLHIQGRRTQNSVSILEDGKVVFRQSKSLLPTYDVFDEARYFEPAHEIKLWDCDGQKLAFAICEDLWARDPRWEFSLYGEQDPVSAYVKEKADLVISLSASPYEWEKTARREEIHQKVAKRVKAPLLYVNQVGATDEILFDGGSLAIDQKGELLGRLPLFENSWGLLELEGRDLKWLAPEKGQRKDERPDEIEILYRGLVVGIREYFRRTGFERAILGLSGGIDSAVVAALGVAALGKNNVLGIAMPSQHSSRHSLEDAEDLARRLEIPFEVRPIKFLFSQAVREISEGRGELAGIAQENLQARLRGIILMTLSNHEGSLILTTGNKSEIAMGYCTLYGDMAGALGPIGDVYKTRVYELARYLNQVQGDVISERVLTKAPSAELKPDQKDQDSLPPYEVLDPLLEDYLEKNLSLIELEAKYQNRAPERGDGWVRSTVRQVELNEYKRRQSAPILKCTAKAFGLGRRIPIAKRWDRDDKVR